MSGIKKWSIPTWIFFHTLAAKINEKFYKNNIKMILFIIKIICKNLPCSECSRHAFNFMKNVNENNVKTKKDLIEMFWTFHNSVNKRTGKIMFKKEDLGKYSRLRFDFVLVNFLNNYVSRFGFLAGGHLSNLSNRKKIAYNLTNWMRYHWKHFQ